MKPLANYMVKPNGGDYEVFAYAVGAEGVTIPMVLSSVSDKQVFDDVKTAFSISLAAIEVVWFYFTAGMPPIVFYLMDGTKEPFSELTTDQQSKVDALRALIEGKL